MNCLNEDDVAELKSIKYKIKSVLEHPIVKLHHYLDCLNNLRDIQERFTKEDKMVPESEEYLDLNDMKLLVSRFISGLEDEIHKREINERLEEI